MLFQVFQPLERETEFLLIAAQNNVWNNYIETKTDKM